MACPFFFPTRRLEDGTWPHPSRLPLGGGWSGHCSVPGHEGAAPSNEELREGCNLGYAASCVRLPAQRPYDAVRFSVSRDCGSQVDLWFACEASHRPGTSGKLSYDASRAEWTSPHSDPRIQKMAECFLESYTLRKIQPASQASFRDQP